MQQRVTFTPSEKTQQFEGKTLPPSSFQDFLQYFQIKGQTDFLSSFLDHVKDLQASKLTKIMPQMTTKDPEPVSVSEGASSSQVASAIIYNSLQPHVKSQIETFGKLITILKQDPSLTKNLDQDLSTLKSIAKSFPKLSEKQLNSLAEISTKLDKYVGDQPLDIQKHYLDTSFHMLYFMWKGTSDTLSDSAAQHATIKQQLTTINKLSANTDQFTTMLAQKGGGTFSPEEMNLLLRFLQSAAEGSHVLSTSEKKPMDAFMQNLIRVQGTRGQPLTQFASEGLVKKWLSDFLSSNPNASKDQIKETMNNFLKESGLTTTDSPFLKGMGKELKDIINNHVFPLSTGKSGVALSKDLGGKVTLNPEYDEQLSKDFALKGETTKAALASKAPVMESLQKASDVLNEYSAGYEMSYLPRRNLHARLGSACTTTACKSLSSGSIANNFYNAIINHWGPNSEKYLMALISLLNFYNLGASVGNTILGKIVDFSDASNNYNFGGSLAKEGSGGNYIGNYSSAKAQLSNEKKQTSSDLNKEKEAIKYIDQEMQKIWNNPKLSASQKSQLMNKLENVKENMETSEGQLEHLKSVLGGISVHKGSDSNHFTVKGSVGALDKAENAVVQGGSGKYPGGLLNIQSEVSSMQTNYSNLGLNQQMKLQMEMTLSQEEWSIASTACQAINQMYQQFAQGINQ